MKKSLLLIISLLLVSLLPMQVMATGCTSSEKVDLESLSPETQAFVKSVGKGTCATITDADGNVLEEIPVELDLVVLDEPTGFLSFGSTRYSLTATARARGSTSDSSDMYGVIATGTLTFSDHLGTTNTLISVSGGWSVGDESISKRSVDYRATDVFGDELERLTQTPSSNSFSYSPVAFEGLTFHLTTKALVDSAGKYITLSFSTAD